MNAPADPSDLAISMSNCNGFGKVLVLITELPISARPYATMSPLAPVFEPHPIFMDWSMV